MNLEDLIKLAGVTKSPYNTPVQTQPTEIEEPPVMDDSEGMRTLIALVTPEQLNQLQGEAPVEEEGYANSGDHYSGEPEEYKGTLGSPADLSLRRYLGANGQPVHVDETKVYEDHKVEDITEAWKSYKAEPIAEVKTELEEEPNEGNEFAHELKKARDAGKDEFEVDGKKYKVKESEMDLNRLKKLAGAQQVDEAPFPGEYDYTNYPQEDEEIKAIMMKHPEEVAKMKQMGDLDSGSDLYMDLYSYYLDSGEMPYGTAKARDGDPVEWIMNRLDDMGMMESKVEEASFDMNQASWKQDMPSELMMVIKKYDLDPSDAFQMANKDMNADIDAIADLHDDFVDRTGSDSDIDGGEEFLASPEYAKVMTMVSELCSAMGMEGGNREECGQALMKFVDNVKEESAEINDLRKLAGI